jgi:hypothetical protein
MRAFPACQVSLRRFGVWRTAVFALTAAGVATVAGWWIGREPPASIESMVLDGVAALAMLAIAASSWHVPAQSLRWDGQAWYLGEVACELSAAIDLGPWPLLRFTPAAKAATHWLPVQRRGLEAQWHALRCAVHSLRPRAGM